MRKGCWALRGDSRRPIVQGLHGKLCSPRVMETGVSPPHSEMRGSAFYFVVSEAI